MTVSNFGDFYNGALKVFSCPGSSIPDLGDSLTDRHFRISTQRVTFETSDPSDIGSE